MGIEAGDNMLGCAEWELVDKLVRGLTNATVFYRFTLDERKMPLCVPLIHSKQLMRSKSLIEKQGSTMGISLST